MPQRKTLLIVLAALLAGVAGLIFVFLQSAAGGVSLSGPAVLHGHRDGAAESRVLPEAHDGVASGPLDLSGAPDATAADSLVKAGPAAVRGAVAGRLVDEAGVAVAGEPVWLALDDDAWEPETSQSPRLPRLVSRTTAGADGVFTLPARGGVEYELRAGGAAWPATRMESVHAGDQLLVVLPRATQLEGTVTDELTGAPIEGARVMALTGAGQLIVDARPDGSFRFGPLPPQDVLVGAWAPGHEVKLVGNVAPAAGPVDLLLPAGRTLQGLLTDRTTEQPLTSGKVQLVLDVEASRPGGDVVPLSVLVQTQDAEVGPDGKFVFEAAPSMGFNLLCTSDGYLPERFDRYEDRALDEGDVLIVGLAPAGAVTGHVQVAAGGAAAADAVLVLSSTGGELGRGVSDASGDFTLKIADGVALDALLARPEFLSARSGDLAARVRVGKEREGLLLELVPTVPFDVQVVNAGVPVAGAEVAARSKAAETTQAVTDGGGLAHLVHAPAGPDVERLILQARHANLESLPLQLDPKELPSGTITLDLSSGAWIEGRVTDAGGSAVPSARVNARPVVRESGDPRRSGYTAADGRFRVGPLPPGVEYRVQFSADGYLDHELASVIPGGLPLEITLAPVVKWSGRVFDALTAQPLPDFWGQLVQESRQGDGVKQRNTGARLHLVSGSPGEFWFELPGPGSYLLRMSARDYVAVNSPTFEFDGLRAPPFSDVPLSQAAVLEVTVLDGRSRPVPGYSVAAVPWEVGREAPAPAGDVRKKAVSGRTDDDGIARLNLGPGGTYRMAGGPGVWFDAGPVVVSPGLPITRLYRLPPTGDIEVRVIDEQGRPLLGAMVEVRTVREENVHSVTRRLRTSPDGDGIVLVETLPPARYDVSARRRNYETERVVVMVSGNELQHVTLKLVPRPDTPAVQGGPGPGGPGPFPPGGPKANQGGAPR
jgi:Carboxypeptidase regulatory-like domain